MDYVQDLPENSLEQHFASDRRGGEDVVAVSRVTGRSCSLLGVAEIGALLGVKPGTVAQWYRRRKLPKPFAVLAMGPVWKRAAIEQWWGPDPISARGRAPRQ